MKTKLLLTAAVVLLSSLSLQLVAGPLGTAFTFQGRMTAGGAAASGLYDLKFALYDDAAAGAQVGPALTNSAVTVSNGLFTVTLDFGEGVFAGSPRWLAIGVRTNGSSANFSALGGRQAVAPSPYALHAAAAGSAAALSGSLPAAQIQGTLALSQLPEAVVTNNASGLALNGSFTGNGAGLTGVVPANNSVGTAQIANGSIQAADVNATTFSTTFWKASGNAGTTAGTHFLGTTDNQAMELRVNNTRALRLVPTTEGYPNVIEGADNNSINSYGSAIGGGYMNSIQTNAYTATIGGGWLNSIRTNSISSTIGGGEVNTIEIDADASTISGGSHNTNTGYHATIPGGWYNEAAAYAFAAGTRAKSRHQGAFVWADYTLQDFASTANNQFLIRASGNVGINKNNPATALDVNGTVTATGFAGAGAGLTGITASGLADGAVTSAKIADGSIQAADVNATTFSNTFWKANGNAGTTGGTHFIGTTDNQPIEFKVNNTRALRLEPAGTGEINVIGGSADNSCATYGGSIGGGRWNNIETGAHSSTVGGGYNNDILVDAHEATIDGGRWNLIQSNAYFSTIGGGQGNTIGTNAYSSTIAGGQKNTIQTNAFFSTIGGGVQNTNEALQSTIGGGAMNSIRAVASNSTIGGGIQNTNTGSCATIPGGFGNEAAAYAFAAGTRAKSRHQGAFVWADSTDADFASTADNQFLIRASGNVGINKNNPATALDVSGTVTATGFAGSGANLTGITASGLANGAVTSLKLANDAASLNKATAGGMYVSGGNVWMGMPLRLNDEELYIRGNGGDTAHGLGWYHTVDRPFGTYLNLDGPVLYGCTGGGLGSGCEGQKLSLRWDSDGDVVIDPGSANIGSLLPGLTFGNASGEGISSRRSGTGGNLYGLDLYTAGASRMTIANLGNVGIGTTSPAQKLHVNGRIRMTTWVADGSFLVYANGTGDFGIQSSDARLKKNVAAISNALDIVKGMRGVTFNWTRETNDTPRTVGLIGQEVKAAMPELTYSFTGENGESYLGVHYEKVAAVLVNAVKEQQGQIEAQEAELAALRSKTASLKQDVAELKSLVAAMLKK